MSSLSLIHIYERMENNSRKEDIELIAAKYEFDFAQSVVGEKKWEYQRALYAYDTRCV